MPTKSPDIVDCVVGWCSGKMKISNRRESKVVDLNLHHIFEAKSSTVTCTQIERNYAYKKKAILFARKFVVKFDGKSLVVLLLEGNFPSCTHCSPEPKQII